MTKLPRITGQQIIKVLQNFGFSVIRIRGSHHYLRHHDSRTTIVPVHSGEIIGPGLMRKILRDCEISKNDFIEML